MCYEIKVIFYPVNSHWPKIFADTPQTRIQGEQMEFSWFSPLIADIRAISWLLQALAEQQ